MNKPKDESSVPSYALETRIDPKTGEPREYKVYNGAQPERRIVGFDRNNGRELTREVQRTPGKPWAIISHSPESFLLPENKVSPLFIQQEFLDEIAKVPMQAAQMGIEYGEYRAMPDTADEFLGSGMNAAVEECKRTQEDFTFIALTGSIDASFTIEEWDDPSRGVPDRTGQLLPAPERNIDSTINVNITIPIYPFDPSNIGKDGEKKVTFSEARVLLVAWQEDLGLSEDFAIDLEPASGYIDLTDGSVHIEKSMDREDGEREMGILHDLHRIRAKNNANAKLMNTLFPHVKELVEKQEHDDSRN